ncbi:DUF3945 domain-containing protein [Flavobacterium sp. GSB-24]|uniref:DUF3945 domain-containing protein n=1 Tax=Flavobacterium sp. GSB-24 TaxID=2994319 RepID=UPI00248FFDB5|nr:DUF3945 domain-containing protein [Flavobacterium sp. GSB-24]BDU25178.1 hypothetical protein FLGSB24_19220 [Flavobacterium sp. GSB-24]
MSEQTTDKAKFPEELSDILLVFDKEKKKIQAVKGIDQDGNLQTVDPTKKNQNQFMRVDRQGDLFSNFFSNFFSQLKNPTNFMFFKVPAPLAVNAAKELREQVNNPTPEFEQILKNNEIRMEELKSNKQENKDIMETTQTNPEAGEYKYKPEQIDWETMNHLGLSKDKLEKMNLLDPMLKGYKTNELVPISLNLGTAVTRLDARLSLKLNNAGEVVVAIHGIRKGPNLNYPFFGHEFTKEDKDNLIRTGNMGRTVDLINPKTNEIQPSLISVDRLTNEVVAFRRDYIKIPEEIKGVKLSEDQKQTLLEGKPLFIEGMVSKKGDAFDATVQFNADKRFVEFLFDRNNTNKQTVDNVQNQTLEASKTFRGKELDDTQYQKLNEGQTVYLSGLVDKKGKEYNGYITFNKETSKIDFSFQNPDKINEQAQPAEGYKTQTAVNSEGKNNEATKNSKETLKSGQTSPDNKKQLEEQEVSENTVKAKGRKM